MFDFITVKMLYTAMFIQSVVIVVLLFLVGFNNEPCVSEIDLTKEVAKNAEISEEITMRYLNVSRVELNGLLDLLEENTSSSLSDRVESPTDNEE